MFTLKDFKETEKKIREYVYRTPLEEALSLSSEDRKVYLKLENQQKTRSVKIRGASSKILSLSQGQMEKGIGAISSGNHGAAVSYMGYRLGIKKVKIYVPESTPDSKIEKILYYGGQIVKVGKNYDECNKIAYDQIQDEGLNFIDPCSDEEVIKGQGTIGLEILGENPKIDSILVPIGGGGIISGVGLAAKAINENIEIIGLQTEACPAMIASLRDKKLYETYPTKGQSICDALVGGVGELPFKLAEKAIDKILTVKEEDIYSATRDLLFNEKIIGEPGSAIGLAALKSKGDQIKGNNICILISGGNIETSLLKKIAKES